MSTRLQSLDFIRGCAVIGMVLYHFVFDLSFFTTIPIDISFWPVALLGAVVRLLFVGIVGVSLFFASQNYSKRKFIKKIVFKSSTLATFAAIITISSWLVFPDFFIRFGVLHLLAVSLLLAIPFVYLPKTSFILGLGISGIGFSVFPLATTLPHLWWAGFITTPIYDLDYFPLIPWFGVVLIGISFGSTWLKNIEPKVSLLLQKLPTKSVHWVSQIGRKTLLIYLLHQAILVPVVLAINLLFGFAK